LTVFLAILMCLFPPSRGDVTRLQRAFPSYLTFETAEVHLIAARAAGVSRGIDSRLLLSIAAHESNFRADVRTPETRGRQSCGVMTPEPKVRCSRTDLTLVGGYDAGAAHLAEWRKFYRGRDLVLAYAGGGGLVTACHHGPWVVNDRDVCRIADDLTGPIVRL